MLARHEWISGYATPSPTTSPPAPGRRGIGALLRLWRARIREREGLAAMTERDLRDARLSRADVQEELAKPFWRG